MRCTGSGRSRFSKEVAGEVVRGVVGVGKAVLEVVYSRREGR